MATTDLETADVTVSDFNIEVSFLGGLTETQQQTFTAATDRWESVIIGDLPDVFVGDQLVDDILIFAQGAEIDGAGSVVGLGGPTMFRPADLSSTALLPAQGMLIFDTADLSNLETQGTLTDAITHEIGHALGVGTLWSAKSLATWQDTDTPLYIGEAAAAEYGRLLGQDTLVAVPLESEGGLGTQDVHFSEAVFQNELMTGFINAGGNALSRLTVASLQDLGYTVDLDAAEPYPVAAAHEALVADAAAVDPELVLAGIPTPAALSGDGFFV